MEGCISVLFKTENCSKVNFNWDLLDEADVKSLSENVHFKNVSNIPFTFKTLIDLALFLDGKQLYGFMDADTLHVFEIFHKYMNKKDLDNCSGRSAIIYFSMDNMLIWKIKFNSINFGLYKYTPVRIFGDFISYYNKVINARCTTWFNFTHDLKFRI